MEEPANDDVAAENSLLREQDRAVALRSSFDRDDSYNWHDASTTFASLLGSGARNDIQVNNDGSIDEVGLRKAVRGLAQSADYLVRSDEPEPRRVPPFPSGGNVGGGRKRYGPGLLDEVTLRRRSPP